MARRRPPHGPRRRDDDDDDGASDDGDDDDDMDDGDDDDAGRARWRRAGGAATTTNGDDGDDDADDDDDDDAPPPGGPRRQELPPQRRTRTEPRRTPPSPADDGDDGDVADRRPTTPDVVSTRRPTATPSAAPDDDDDAVAESDGAAPAASDDDVACAEAEEDDEPAPTAWRPLRALARGSSLGWSLWVSASPKYRLEKFADEALAPCGDVVMIDGFDADVELRLELLRAATAGARPGCDADRRRRWRREAPPSRPTQKALRDRPKHVKERPGADQAAPEGMLFKALKAECRYKMIATSEDQVKNYLVELTDHNLVTKKVHLGSVFVCMAPDYVDKIPANAATRRSSTCT
ncbi:hypothetical protein JL721_13091 [Aureococcus anophagefferens]|nr:hypothetical protein JL721_13091 [Aureococcus anophagefferens]